MVSIKQLSFFLLLLTLSLPSFGALNLDFIDGSFDDFMVRINVPEEQRTPFKHYYARLTAQLNEAPVSERQVLQGYFYQNALTALKADYPQWHALLMPFITDPRITLDTDINNVRTVVGGFLIRYGAYHEFCTRLKAMHNANRSVKTVFVDAWDGMSSRASRMKGTIKDWFTTQA